MFPQTNHTMKTQPSSPNRRGFTLIELLVVITIIVILAGLSMGGYGYIVRKQADSQAAIQISLLSKALEEYKLDFGVYPGAEYKDSNGNVLGHYGGAAASNADGLNSNVLYSALYEEGVEHSKTPGRSDPYGIKATKIYVSALDPENDKQGWIDDTGNKVKIVDPFGAEYIYRLGVDAKAKNPDFDLLSRGKDGETDDSNPDASENRDDIDNF